MTRKQSYLSSLNTLCERRPRPCQARNSNFLSASHFSPVRPGGKKVGEGVRVRRILLVCNCPNRKKERKKESAIVRPPFLSPTINARKKNSGPGYCAAIQRFQLANSKRGRERARTQSPRAISNSRGREIQIVYGAASRGQNWRKQGGSEWNLLLS